MGYFDIDYDKLSRQLLPVRLRQPQVLAWNRVIVKGVKDIYDRFATHRADNVYTLTHNSQVFSMEAVLNDAFDAVSRGIYITDHYRNAIVYIGTRSEIGSTPYDCPRWIGTRAEVASGTAYPDTWLFRTSEGASTAYDFQIYVPVGVVYDAARFAALVDKYKLPGKTWNIITY